jgi:D-glycero-alpha-D-manno-heptose 1-phosphate guanylyltransferase
MINKPIIILAGGFGSRLQTILKGKPKPLADINGTPFVFYLLKNLIEKGFNDFIFSLYFEADKIIDFIEKNKKGLLLNCSVRYVTEPSPMGTGGAISFLIKSITIADEFFVVNADTWIKDGFSVLNSYNDNVIGILKLDNTSRYGRVYINDENVITKFEEKIDESSAGYINTGVYKLTRSIFLKWDGLPFSLENDLFPQLIKTFQIKGVLIQTEFIDIGVPEDYFKFCSFNLTNEYRFISNK